jgi:hydroxymethylpyrimidine pyrophosphatase-like HAD family hydrolase
MEHILLGDEILDEDCRNCLFEFAKQVVAYLKKFNFLIFDNGKIGATQLGKAAFASSIPPEHSLKIFHDLHDARGDLVLDSDLHLLYLITPHFKQLREPNWEVFIQKFKSLSKSERNVAQKYDIIIEYLYKATVYPPKLPNCLLD